MNEDDLKKLIEKLDSMPEFSDEEIEQFNKWGAVFTELLSDAEKDIGMSGIMTLTSKAFVTLAVLHNVDLDRLQVGVALTYMAVKQSLEEDNLTSSQVVH